MAGQRGRDVLTCIGDGGSPEAFVTVAGVRARAIMLSSEVTGSGANVALVETETGLELLQFREAERVDVETYKLGSVLCGQQGSEDTMAAGAPASSRIAFLTGAEQRLDMVDWERGLELV